MAVSTTAEVAIFMPIKLYCLSGSLMAPEAWYLMFGCILGASKMAGSPTTGRLLVNHRRQGKQSRPSFSGTFVFGRSGGHSWGQVRDPSFHFPSTARALLAHAGAVILAACGSAGGF